MADQVIGVLLMAYGAAGSLEEVAPYLADIRAGRPPSPELVEEVKHRYQLMGGRSPLLEITKQQAAALEALLNQPETLSPQQLKEGSQRFDLGGRSGEKEGSSHAPQSPALAPAEPDARFSPVADAGRGGIGGPFSVSPHGPPHIKVYIGMRHWHPYIKDTVAAMAKEGIRKVVGLCLTPYYSRMSVGAYFKKLEEAQTALNTPFEMIRVESWNDHPLLIEAITQKVQKALDGFDPSIRNDVAILFSAHSLPSRILEEKDPYPQELNETIQAVMKKVGSYRWWFAYQSQGRTPEPWLGPDAGEVINRLHQEGYRHLLMAPIGFISDHMETLYDVDIMYRKQAESLGMQLQRAESLNATPTFIEAMASVVRTHLS
jgi:ferrochelatase